MGARTSALAGSDRRGSSLARQARNAEIWAAGAGLSCRSLDLKGAEAAEIMGKTLQVLYDEGGPSPVPYIGLVVYVESARCACPAEAPGPQPVTGRAQPPSAPPLAIPLLAQLCLLPCRIYVVFDGFDEAEGAWVDDSDDWSWTDGPDVKLPVPAPSPPAWSESQPAGLVDKVFLHRTDEKGQPSTFFVKWKEAVRGGPAPAPRCTPR